MTHDHHHVRNTPILPNLQKTIHINRSVAEVAQALEHIPLFSDQYTLFKAQSIINQYTFETQEFLGFGAYIDLNYTAVDADRTEVMIEIRRKQGLIDTESEIASAVEDLSKMASLIAKSLETDLQVRLDKVASNELARAEKELAEKLKQEDKQKADDERKRKNELEKQNSPFKYYMKQLLGFVILFGFVGGIIYLIYRMFT
jgi:hypothetical protein